MLTFHPLKQNYCHPYFLAIVFSFLVASCDKTGSPAQSFEVASKGTYSGAISHSGEYALLGSIHHGASFWDVKKQARLFSWNHQSDAFVSATSSALSYDGKFGLTVEQYAMALWNTKTGEGIRHWRAPAKVLDAQLSQTGRYALLGLENHQAVLFDIQNGGVVRELNHTDQVVSVSLENSGRLALTGSDDQTAVIWDLSTGQKKHTLSHNDKVTLAVLSHDGTLAFTMSQYDQASLWDTQTGQALGSLPLKAERLKRGLRYTSAAFSHDNQLLLVGRPDQIVELWEIPSMEQVAKWKLPKRNKWKPTNTAVQDVQFASTTRFIALASNGLIHILEKNDK